MSGLHGTPGTRRKVASPDAFCQGRHHGTDTRHLSLQETLRRDGGHNFELATLADAHDCAPRTRMAT